MALTGTLWHLLLAMAVFLASHAIPARKGLRDRAAAVFGNTGYHIAYSLLSIAVVVWLIAAYAGAPYVEVWEPRPWMRWPPFVAMLFASILLVAGLGTPNPFSLGRGGRGYDPARPGILRLTRHPLLWALILWAGAHIPANGDVSSLILFLPLLLLALAGPALMERKRRRELGERWTELAAGTGRGVVAVREIGPWRLLGGVGVYAALLHFHPYVIGVSPLPYAFL